MGVVGAVATTAVVAGTAGAVRHHQDQKWSNQAAEQQAQQQAQQASQQAYEQQAQMEAMQQQMAQMQAQQAAAAAAAPAAAAAAPAPAAGGGSSDLMTQLNQLTQLHQAGALTDEEYTAAKAKLLA
jgi:hypothetical protein